jgi:hypothetical protein
MEKIECGKCKQQKPASAFYKNRARPNGLCWCCKDCSKGYIESRNNEAVEDGTRVCSVCFEEKPLIEFNKNKRGAKGRDSRCRSCKGVDHATRDNAPAVDGTKTCRTCGIEKLVTSFTKKKANSDGRSGQCKACHQDEEKVRYHADPVWAWEKNSLRRLGLTAETYNAELDAQKGVCYICHKTETRENQYGIKRLAVDHDHRCCPPRRACGKCRRHLLCSVCNQGLGYFQDDPELLEAAAAYLRACSTPS